LLSRQLCEAQRPESRGAKETRLVATGCCAYGAVSSASSASSRSMRTTLGEPSVESMRKARLRSVGTAASLNQRASRIGSWNSASIMW
jgi:hypothetical protein